MSTRSRSRPSEADRRSLWRFGALVAAAWVVASAVTAGVVLALDPAPDVVNAGYLASMFIFGFGAVALAIVIARLGDLATPSDQGPEWSPSKR